MAKKKKTLQAPMVHLNGTGREQLLESLEVAYQSANDTMDKLRMTSPNGRDYYPLGQEKMDLAVSQHVERMRKIQQVLDELHAVATAILNNETETEYTGMVSEE